MRLFKKEKIYFLKKVLTKEYKSCIIKLQQREQREILNPLHNHSEGI